MARKTWADSQITRHRILEAAGAVFLEQGFAGGSLQQIADAAGMTRGAIYWHFANKQDLISALMARSPSCEHSSTLLTEEDAVQALKRLAMAPLDRLQRSAPLQKASDISEKPRLSVDAIGIGRMLYEEQRALWLVELEIACDKVQRQVIDKGEHSSRGAALGLTWLVEGLMLRWTRDPEAFDLLGFGSLAISAYVQGMHEWGLRHDAQRQSPGSDRRTQSPA